MLTQFKIRYPQGNLISELVAIDCDTYIIKASIVVNGITIATGMAGAETIEVAEERSKERALALLDLNTSTSNLAETKTKKMPEPTEPKINLTEQKISSNNSLIKSESWNFVLAEEMKKDYFVKLLEFIEREGQETKIFPPKEEIFTALEITPLEKIKVVILGQDPYHGVGQAHGLSFSVKKGVSIPRSLENIFKELASDLNIKPPNHGNLTHWATQGVLMLNTVLTVRAHKANSHKNKGWEIFTDRVIEIVNEQTPHVVFVLWGKEAQKKIKLIDDKHTIIKSPHPSPFSAKYGFFGSRPFSKINSALQQAKQEPIDWTLPA